MNTFVSTYLALYDLGQSHQQNDLLHSVLVLLDLLYQAESQLRICNDNLVPISTYELVDDELMIRDAKAKELHNWNLGGFITDRMFLNDTAPIKSPRTSTNTSNLAPKGIKTPKSLCNVHFQAKLQDCYRDLYHLRFKTSPRLDFIRYFAWLDATVDTDLISIDDYRDLTLSSLPLFIAAIVPSVSPMDVDLVPNYILDYRT
ncbi:hypothetical protein VNO77_22285 [Canavalia gladiata]|uniref:Uncharacterized protein n=1 Tax=Canavalia gladiata TaxID=3824 RepID=A0AAN9L3A5_CANGL